MGGFGPGAICPWESDNKIDRGRSEEVGQAGGCCFAESVLCAPNLLGIWAAGHSLPAAQQRLRELLGFMDDLRGRREKNVPRKIMIKRINYSDADGSALVHFSTLETAVHQIGEKTCEKKGYE